MGEGGSTATVEDPSPETASYEDCTLWVCLSPRRTAGPLTGETQPRSELAAVLVCQFCGSWLPLVPWHGHSGLIVGVAQWERGADA